MKSYKKTHGAVSIFLVLILVPCLVFTSIFVDLGRAHMSKAMAESSGDLALNTLMTNYDGDLNEWYGFIASTQDISKYYDTATQYFLRSMSSQKIEGYETSLISDYAQSAFDDTKISDLLKCDVQTPPSKIIGPVPDANLTNPALIKVQTVEFMKYRGPIEIARGLFGRLSGDPDAGESSGGTDMADADENEKLVEKKQDYYEAEGELQAAAFYTYVAIRSYYRDGAKTPYGYSNAGPLNNAKLKDYADSLAKDRKTYAAIHHQYVKYFANTGELKQYFHPKVKLSDYQEKDPAKAFNKDPKKLFKNEFSKDKDESGNEIYTIDGDDYHDLMDDLKQAIKDFETARNNLAEKAKELLNNRYGSETDPEAVNPIQWWIKMDKAINTSGQSKKVKEAGEKMMTLYLGIYFAENSDKVQVKEPLSTPCNKPNDQKTEKEKDHEKDAHSRAAAMISQVEGIQKKYFDTNISEGDSYQSAVYLLEKVSRDYISKINPDTATVTVDGKTETVSKMLKNTAEHLTGLYNYLDGLVKKLDIAIKGDGDRTKSLDELKSLAARYNSTFTDWSNEAHTGGTDMKDADAKAIDQGYTGKESKYNVDRVAKEITEQAVKELKLRLTNIRDQLKKLVDAIDSMTYGGAKMKDLSSIAEMRKRVKIDTGELEKNWLNKQIDAYADKTFDEIVKPKSETVVTLDHLSGNSHNPDIDPAENNSVQTPFLYVYFAKQWGDKSAEEVDKVMDEKDQAMGQAQSQVDDAIKEAAGDDPNRKDIKPEFSKGHSDAAVVNFVKSIGSLIKTLINGNFTSVRDDILSLTYMRNMFTFATFENEGYFGLLSKEDKEKVGLTTKSTYYDKVKDKWKNEDPEFRNNKSLTNKMLCRANNAAYQAELEYILYGGDTCSGNVAKAYAEIYAIRLILNTISAFQYFWTGKSTLAVTVETVADALMTATLGIIPAPVWKCILLLIIAMIESALDITRLSCGFPVELYKSEEQWYLNVDATDLGGLMKALAGGGDVKPNGTKGIFYSDYLTLFMYLALAAHGDVEADMYRRTAEVIQANMRQHSEIGSGYSMANAQVYFKLEAVIRVRPLMITLPIFNDPAYENNMDTKTDWCTYTVNTVRGYS